jgi:hypothetical protein
LPEAGIDPLELWSRVLFAGISGADWQLAISSRFVYAGSLYVYDGEWNEEKIFQAD